MLNHRFTLRQLQVFEAAARHASFRRAADELHLSPPAVSMQIKQLEEHLGVPLFEQLGRRVHLTEAGEALWGYVRRVGAQLEEMSEFMADLGGGRAGHLRLSVVTTAKYFVPALLGVFTRRFPGITLSLDVTNRETLLSQLADNALDLAVMGRPPAEADVEAAPFAPNPLVVFAPAAHPLAQETAIPIERLAEEPFIYRESGSGSRMAAERFFAEHGVRPRVVMEVASNEAIKQCVAAGLGLGMLSATTLVNDVAAGRVVVLDVAGLPIERQWFVVHRRGKRLGVVAEAFRRFLVDEAAGLMAAMVPTGMGRGEAYRWSPGDQEGSGG